jgi:hypothetical protein
MLRATSLLLLCGCFPMHALALGEPVPPKPENCPVRQLRMTQTQAEAQYGEVGVICAGSLVMGAGHEKLAAMDPEERADFERTVCGLGGEIVVATGLCSIGKAAGIEWRVYREKVQ